MAFAALLSLATVTAAVAEIPPVQGPAGPPDPDFTNLSLEELLQVDLVFAASRRAQSVGEAPSMVTVISREEIRHQGYRTLADLFRAVPGFYVSTDHNYTYLGVRGFARPGDYNSRVLVLLNGVRLNDNVYDQATLGNDFTVDLALVERVEIARGPAASLYGNNAFFAVVNIVTRKGSELRGGEIAGVVGGFGERRTRATWGTRLPSGLDVAASVSTIALAGQDLCFPEYEAEGSCARGLNGESARRGFLTATWGDFQVQAIHSWRRKEIPTGSFATTFGDPRNRTWDSLTRTSLQYSRSGARASVTARLDHGRSDYSGTYIYPEAEGSKYDDGAVGRWWTLDSSTTLAWGSRHLLTAGAELQWDQRMDQRGSFIGVPRDVDVHADGTRWGVYVTDEIRLAERLHAQLGARLDVTDSGIHRTSPRVGLVHSSPRGAIKLLYGSAFRAPNQYEQFYYPATGALRVESIRTLELVAERNLTTRLRVSVAGFDNRIADLLSLTGETDELLFLNSGRIRSRGVELVGDWRGSTGARARASYSFQRTTDTGTGLVLSNSPSHLAKANLDLPLFTRRLWVGSALEHASSRQTLAGATLPGFTLANLTLHAPALQRHLNLTLSVSNLFDTVYAQPGSEEHLQDALEQGGRAVSLEASWRF